jgi:hypothetical protein
VLDEPLPLEHHSGVIRPILGVTGREGVYRHRWILFLNMA